MLTRLHHRTRRAIINLQALKTMAYQPPDAFTVGVVTNSQRKTCRHCTERRPTAHKNTTRRAWANRTFTSVVGFDYSTGTSPLTRRTHKAATMAQVPQISMSGLADKENIPTYIPYLQCTRATILFIQQLTHCLAQF